MLKAADQLQDLSGQDQHKILQLFASIVPPFVKAASIEERCGGNDLAAGAYADPQRKLYPCNTAAATWLSGAFFFLRNEKNANDNLIERKLLESANFFGITDAVEDLRAESKTASSRDFETSDDDYALLIQYSDHVDRKYPLRNSAEIKKAAEYLCRYRHELPYEDRQAMATRILDKAGQIGADIRNEYETLTKTAGLGMCLPEDARDLLMNRAAILRQRPGQEKLAADMATLAGVIEQQPDTFHEFDKLAELAKIVDEVDRALGLVDRYGKGSYNFPEETLFAVTEKMAEEARNELVELPSGTTYKMGDLLKISADVYRSAMGTHFADMLCDPLGNLEATKLAEVMPTLPLPDAQMFDRVLGNVGVRPVLQKAAATGYSHVQDPQIQAKAAELAAAGPIWQRLQSARAS